MGLLDFEKFAPERHTSGDPHGVKLRQAIREAQRGECPICTLLNDQEQARVHWLAYEGLSDAGLRTKLLRSKGFCGRHFRLLYSAVSEQTYNLSGVADLMRALLQSDIAALNEALAETKPSRSARRATAGLRPAANCPLCDAAAEAEARKIGSLLTELAQEEFRQVYFASPGLLCRPHLVVALTQEPSPVVAEALLHKHLQTVTTDDAELAEFIRKKDYRYASEAKGDEQRAPRRAVESYVGTWPR
jgi:hypothetical protein